MMKKKHNDRLSTVYDKQRRSFIADLILFNEKRGTPFVSVPKIAGREIDLYHLYQRVTGYGGWQKVNNAEKWEDFQEEFGLPKGCVNSAQALKNIYFRYLSVYEKVNFLGEDPDTKNSDEDEGPVRKKICLPVETIPLYYNYNQHKLTDAQRQQHCLSTPVGAQSKYDKLTLSLCSGLPNEVDLAVSACVLLSTEGRHSMRLENSSQLLRLLLSHVGIFDQNSDDMQDLYQHCWTHHTNRNFLRFWFETVNRSDVRSLLLWRGHQYIQKELVGSDVLNLGRHAGIQDIEGQRVLQIAVVLHNLSFEDANQKTLANSHLVYKFLLLSFYSSYGGLRQLALDTLANISCELELDAFNGLDSQLVPELFNCALFSEDRFFVVRGLEILSKLCQLTCNESILLNHLRDDVFKRLVDLLTVQDIQLIVHTLEALYKLSKVGEPFTTRIAHVHRAVDTLVSLTTIKAQSFGPASLVGIKVMEYVPPSYVMAEGGDNVRRATTVIQPVNPDTVNIYQVPANSQSQFGVVPNTGGHGVGSSVGGHVLSRTPSFTNQRLVTDIHTTTSNWLNATYDLKTKSKVNQVKLFSDYLQFCRNFGIKKALSSSDFLHLVKVIFHNCEVLSIKRKNGDRHVYLEGLCKRSTQQPFAVAFLATEKGYGVSPQLQQDTPRNYSQRNVSQTAAKSGKVVTPKRGRIPKNVKAQSSTPGKCKRILIVKNSSGNTCNILDQTITHTSPLLNHKHNLTTGKSQTIAMQTDKANAAHFYSVKSLLAQKLSKGMPEKGASSSPGPSNRAGNITHCSQSSVVVKTSTIATSKHNSFSQQQHQTVSCKSPPKPPTTSVLTKPSALAPSTSIGLTINPNHQSSQCLVQCHQNHTTLSETTIDYSSIDFGLAQQSTNQNSATSTQKNKLPSLSPKQTILIIHNNIPRQEQNSKVPVSEQITVSHRVPQNYSISVGAQPNPTVVTNWPSVKPSSDSTQQNTVVKLPKTTDREQQECNNSTDNGVCIPQSLSAQVIHVTGINSFRNLCSMSAANFQTGSTASSSNMVTLTPVTAQNTSVTWSLSSPAVTTHSTSAMQPLSSPAITTHYTSATQLLSSTAVTTHSTSATQPLSSPAVTTQVATQSFSSPMLTAELTTSSLHESQIQTSPSMTTGQTQQLISNQTPTDNISHTPSVPNNVKTSSQPQSVIASTSDNCSSPWQQQQTNVIHQSPSLCSGITSNISQCQPPPTSPYSGIPTNSSHCPPSSTPLSTEHHAVRPSLHLHDYQQNNSSGPDLNISPPIEIESQTHLPHQQTALSNHCNGFSHEVHAILDSPESISTDFPASPLSSGLSSDIDYSDEKFMQMKSILFNANHTSGEHCLNESTKNGYCFLHEDNSSSLKHVWTETHKTGEQDNGLDTVPEVLVGNGCFSDVIQRSDSLDEAGNILNCQGDVKSNVYSSVNNVLNKGMQGNQNLGMQEEVADINVQKINQPPTAKIEQNQTFQANQLRHHPSIKQQEVNITAPQQPHKQILQQTQHLQKHAHPQEIIIQHDNKHQQPQLSNSCQQLSGCLQQSVQLYPETTFSTSLKPSEPQLRPNFDTPSNLLPGTGSPTSTIERIQQNGQSLQAQITYKRKSKEMKLDAQSLLKKTMPQNENGLTKEACSMQSINQKSVKATMQYICEWDNCRRCFSSSRLVFLHVYKQHLPRSAESCCQWTSCEKLVRKRWSLVSHIQNNHCSEKAMHMVCQTEPVCSKQQKSGTSSASPPAPSSRLTGTYSPEAAVKAVGRFSVRRPYPELTDEREGPVSKHIHLMAALILRNISHFSALGRRLIRRHEQELSYSTMSDVEASSALSQCLWDITEFCNQSPLVS